MGNVFQLFAGWPLEPDGTYVTASRLSQHKVNCLPHRASIHQALSHSGDVVDKRLKPRQFKIRRIKTRNTNVFFGKLLGQFSGETAQTLFTGKKSRMRNGVRKTRHAAGSLYALLPPGAKLTSASSRASHTQST